METNVYEYGQSNFDLPHDIVPLPSGGIFYKSKKKAIKIGYLTANDENLLVGALRKTNTNLIINLLRTKIYEHDLKVEELIESDVEAILLFLRNTSFGTDYNISVKDPVSNTNFDTVVSLEEMNFKKTSVKPNENGYFETTLPKSNVVVKLRPISYTETIELDEMFEKYPKERTAPVITWRLTRHIIEYDGITDKSKISSMIERLPIGDSKYIRNFLKENTPALDLKKEVKTPSGEMVTVDVAFGVEFFRPFFQS